MFTSCGCLRAKRIFSIFQLDYSFAACVTLAVLQLQNEDAVKMSRYIFKKVLKVQSEQAGLYELADYFGPLL